MQAWIQDGYFLTCKISYRLPENKRKLKTEEVKARRMRKQPP